MTARLFSVIRRRPNYVDVVTPFTLGSDGYRLKWASNFDGSFTSFLTAPNTGFVDPSINPNIIDAQPMGGIASNGGRHVRIIFNPATFSIPDASSFWLVFVQTVAGVEQTPSAPTLILPDSANHGVGMVTIKGNAPNVANSGLSLQIDLPRLMESFHIHNESSISANPPTGGSNLFVSTEAGGAETAVPPDSTEQFSQLRGTQGSLWVRGGGAIVAFSARFTLAFPR